MLLKDNRCLDNNMDQTMDMNNECVMPCPVYECPQERECHRQIVIEVPHVVPVNTKIINHYIYHHSYSPCYTCTECNTCESIYDPCSKNF